MHFKPESSVILSWLQEKIAAELACQPSTIQLNTVLANLKLDSIILVTISADLGDWSNCFVDPTIFWEFKDIKELIDWLIEQSLSETT